MTTAVLGAILLVFVVARTWMTGARWYDAIAAILLGFMIGTAGDGTLHGMFATASEWIRAFFNAVANFF